jgi:DNA polymerase-3 subunit epsilon
VREAIESALPLRRCPRKLSQRFTPDEGAPCVPAQLGVATCPCRGQIDDAGYAEITQQVRAGLGSEPAILLEPLEARMATLAAAERFEEAAATRDRLAALSRAISRQRMVDQLRAARSLVVEGAEGRLELHHGRLTLTSGPGSGGTELAVPIDSALPPARDEIDELLVIARHLAKAAASLRLERAAGTYASVLPVVPSYETTRSRDRDPLVAP